MNKDYSKWMNSKTLSESDKEILKKMSEQEIAYNFDKPLKFGTAGIRSHMGLGTSMINRYTIKMISYAWIKSLEKEFSDTLKKPLVVAHDTRLHGEDYSYIIAQIISGMGYKAVMFENNVATPTPIVSFTIRDLNLGGGAVITASHNPPIYNGFKCFTDIGKHLMPENSDPIASELEKIDINTKIPMSEDNISYLDKGYEDYYVDTIAKHLNLNNEMKKDIKVVFSPQHGASYILGPKILEDAGYDVYKVKKQSIPDGNFPDTPDPNPENPAAFNEMLELGKEKHAELLLTTDPDGDRVAMAALHNNEYIIFNGHTIASLLTYYYLDKLSKKQDISGEYIVKSIVTSSLIDKIANSHNVKVVNTLTGFKYIGDIISKSDKPPLIASEESYGSSLCPNLSLDKDGIQVLPILAEACQYYKNQGKTFVDVLNDIYAKFGYYITYNDRLVIEGKKGSELVKKMISHLAAIKDFGDVNLIKVEDYRKSLNGFDKSDLVILYFEGGSSVAVRPSGTEPLIRKYFCITAKNESDAKELERKIKNHFSEIENEIINIEV